MSAETRYSIERVKDRLWVVVDKAREGRRIGRASDETGAHTIVSLLKRLRGAPLGVEVLSRPGLEAV
jgi:hypothetical protein